MTALRKLALQLILGGALAGLVAAEARAQWGWNTPAPPATPSAQAPGSTPPAPGASRGENFSAKPAAQLFSSDCTGAGCHKGPQGLARDRGAGSLASFLREHYTNSRESAAALAAYLVSTSGPARADPKQPPSRAAARSDDAKPAERKPPAAPVPPAAIPSGESSDIAKPEPAVKPELAKPAVRAQRGRQAATVPAPPAAAPAPEPVVPPPPPEPPKPQWDIFD